MTQESRREEALAWLNRHRGQTVRWRQSSWRHEQVFSGDDRLERDGDGLYRIAGRGNFPGFSIRSEMRVLEVSERKLILQLGDDLLRLTTSGARLGH